MEEEVLHKLDDDLKKYFPDFDFKLKDFQKKVISNVIEHLVKINGVKYLR